MRIIEDDIKRFAELCAAEAYTSAEFFEESGIGIYNEKRMHKILKRMMCDRESCYEIKVGRYVADICDDGVITEIQCGAMAPLKEKLSYYLENTEYDVCVVHPIVARRRIIRADKETGEVLRSRLSSKKETEWQGMAELYPIRELLSSPRLSVRLMIVEVEEYRFSERVRYRKKGAYDREVFPTALRGSVELDGAEDYRRFLPDELSGREFGAKDYEPYTPLRGRDVYSALNVLAALGIVEREKQGRSVIYKG